MPFMKGSRHGWPPLSVACAFAFVLTGMACARAESTEDPLRSSLRACAALTENMERLTCYDRVVQRLASDTATPPEPPTPEEMFGAASPSVRGKSAGDAERHQRLDRITERVAALRELADGSVLIELDNGQTWRQVGTERALVLKKGDSVTISRAAFGTFRLATPTQRYARVRRVR